MRHLFYHYFRPKWKFGQKKQSKEPKTFARHLRNIRIFLDIPPDGTQTTPGMPNLKSLFLNAALLPVVLWFSSARAAVMVSGLQCEYLTDPLGIDVQTPRFSWKLSDADHARGQKQTGYRVLVASSPGLLEEGRADIWDSGQVLSPQSALVPFAGKDLTSGQDCFWKVRVLDKDKKPSDWSSPARFSMGLLEADDWTGTWIRDPTAPKEKHIWFRKTFTLREKASSAFVCVASVGYHELYVNGQKVDARVLAPSLTRLDKRVLYVTYDLTRALKAGDNCIAVWTGPGWSRYSFFNTVPALRVQLFGKTTGGGALSLASDSSWRCQTSSSEDIGGCQYKDHGGEQMDARKYIPDWNAVEFDDKAWSPAAALSIHATLSAQMVEPSRVIETLRAKSISGSGPYKLDFGTNFSGWISIKMRNQSAGNVVTLQVSDNPGTNQAFGQKSVYICNGESAESFQNKFNYTAGRYLTISGLKNKPALGDIEGYVIGTDLNRVGRFSCSSDLFNQIYETDLWTYRANTVEGYTSDCPHRERLGYGEENFATAWGCGIPNYDAGAFYTKVVRDWCDVRQADGWINHTAPQINTHYGGAMWSSAPLNIGWEFYKNYADKRILAQSYATDKAWLDYLASNVADGILQPYNKTYNQAGAGNFLGDWAEPRTKADPLAGKEFGNTPEALLFNNCDYALDLRTFIQIAKILDLPGDAAVYGGRLEDLKSRVQARFFNPDQNTYIDSRQIHLAFPMFAGITPDNLRPKVFANFEKEILQTRPWLDMGSSGLPVLLKFLIEDVERNDILFAHLSKTTEPGYGCFLARGETAWPEYWEDDCPSRIHTCYTGIAAWFIKGLGGIREDPSQFGYQSFILKPAMPGNLTFAEAKTDSLYGTISSRWEKKGAAIQMNIEIPANSTATVYVPANDVTNVTESGLPVPGAIGVRFLQMEGNRAVFQVQSGVYQFVSK
jgi:alpha-L-rhamnosidase